MDKRPLTSFVSENFKKRGSWSNTTTQQEPRDPKKKRGSAPLIASALVREYLSQYGDWAENPIRPPPGYEHMASPDLSPLSDASPSSSDPVERLPALCRSQTGSRKAQSTIQRANPATMERIVQILSPHLPQLMTDAYGNYACQTLFQTCNPPQRLQLIRHLQVHLVDIAQDGRGTHSLQVLITLINLPEEEEILMSTFSPRVMDLAMHTNASHVIQKMISTAKNNSPLVLQVAENLPALCTDALGLLVVKVSVSSARQQDVEVLRGQLISNCILLMQDPFGNYAIQHMLETWGWQACRDILKQVKGKISQLSLQKFASNSVERLLEQAGEADRAELLSELSNSFKLRELLGNKFSQCVLKKAITLGGDSFKDALRTAISGFPPNLQASKREKWGGILSILQ